MAGSEAPKVDPLAARMASGGGSAARPIGAAAFVERERRRRERGHGPARALFGAGIVALAVGGWIAFAWAPAPTAAGSAETATPQAAAPRAELDEDVRRLSREREAQAEQIAEQEKRIAELVERRKTLEKQVADLAAPLEDHEDDQRAEAAARGDAPAGERSNVADEPATGMTSSDTPERSGAPPPVEETATAEPGAETIATAATGPVRVFIHVRAGDPTARARADAIARALQNDGVEVAGIRGVPHAVRQDMVRFFYDDDQIAVGTLERAMRGASGRSAAPLTQDFRNRRIAPRKGTLEIWLS
ncbi:hypothetical protein ACFSCV_07480 [Methylopila henanensis]|uniref:LytR/CpsA/Psr regulator C-terminal domain-containing protein n=1 Tax=Methylopila henanensis TaxID=873516 RepID=A0ABW4K600_9HYPH